MGIINKTREYIITILVFWNSIFIYAFIAGIISAISIMGAETVITFLAYWITLRSDPTAKISEYYGPHYFDGTIIFFGISFFIFLIHGAAQKYRRKEIELENLSWSGVEIEPYYFIYHGAYVAALKIRNNKLIKIIALHSVIYELWMDHNKITENYNLYWSNKERIIHMFTMDVLCQNGGEGIIPLAIGTNEKAYIVDNEKDDSNRISLERGKEYQIHIVIYGEVESGATPKPLPSFKGTIIYESPNIKITPAT